MKKLFAVFAAAILVSGCASYLPMGAYYTDGKMGIQDNGGNIEREGRACMKSILGMVATGDASIAAAKSAGQISNVATIDYEVNNILGVVGEYCTVVRGS